MMKNEFFQADFQNHLLNTILITLKKMKLTPYKRGILDEIESLT